MTIDSAIQIFENFDYSTISPSNRSKQRNLNNNAVFFLETLAPYDGDLTARETKNHLLNIGDIAEACIKYAFTDDFSNAYPGAVDMLFEDKRIEIKVALGPASSSSELSVFSDAVLLVNGKGVWMLPYEVAVANSNKGKFKFIQEFDEVYRRFDLEETLGWDEMPSRATR